MKRMLARWKSYKSATIVEIFGANGANMRVFMRSQLRALRNNLPSHTVSFFEDFFLILRSFPQEVFVLSDVVLEQELALVAFGRPLSTHQKKASYKSDIKRAEFSGLIEAGSRNQTILSLRELFSKVDDVS